MADQKDKSLKKVSGGTIIDYVAWRGDLTFEHSPWGEIDAVIAAMVAYANLGENELVFGSGQTLRLADLATTDLLTRLPQEGIPGTIDPLTNAAVVFTQIKVSVPEGGEVLF